MSQLTIIVHNKYRLASSDSTMFLDVFLDCLCVVSMTLRAYAGTASSKLLWLAMERTRVDLCPKKNRAHRSCLAPGNHGTPSSGPLGHQPHNRRPHVLASIRSYVSRNTTPRIRNRSDLVPNANQYVGASWKVSV